LFESGKREIKAWAQNLKKTFNRLRNDFAVRMPQSLQDDRQLHLVHLLSSQPLLQLGEAPHFDA
jgi:hypothetical protein